MSTTPLGIYELKISMSTIIPGQRQDITFNRSMLYNPENKSQSSVGLSNNPLFTFEVRYPIDKINKSYDSIIEFFFNKQAFETVLRAEEHKIGNKPPAVNDPDYIKYCNDKNDITTHNIMAMLSLLFPTRYPVINDIKDSYSIHKGTPDLKTLLFNPLTNHRFSYLKIGSETYTTQKVIWKNDMMNHPDYREFLMNKNRGFSSKKSSNEFLNNFQEGSTSNDDKREIINGCYNSSCTEPNVIYTGVDFVGTTSIVEIYVMMDFIKGEVNKSNMKSIFCSLFGEITGKGLEDMYKRASSIVKTNSHYVDTNRYMFSVKDMKNINTDDKQDVKTTNDAEYMKMENEYNALSEYVRRAFDTACGALDHDTRFNESLKVFKFGKKELLVKLKMDSDVFKAIEGFEISGKRFADRDLNALISRITRNARDIENRMNMSYDAKRDFEILNLAKLKILLLEQLIKIYPGGGGSRPPGKKATIVLSPAEVQRVGLEFHNAIITKDILKLRELCDEWAGNRDVLNFPNTIGDLAPIQTVCDIGFTDGLKELINTSGVDVNIHEHDTPTALWIASFKGNIADVKILLAVPKLKIDHAPISTMITALGIAEKKAKGGLSVFKEVVNALRSAGASLTPDNNKTINGGFSKRVRHLSNKIRRSRRNKKRLRKITKRRR